MVQLENVKVFEKNLVLGLLTRNEVGVLCCTVDSPDVGDLNDAGTVLVHLCEGLHGKTLSEVVHRAANRSQELIVIDATTMVAIKDLESNHALIISKANSKLCKGLHGLIEIKRTISRVIVISEGAAETHDSTSTTRLHFFTDLSDNKFRIYSFSCLIISGSDNVTGTLRMDDRLLLWRKVSTLEASLSLVETSCGFLGGHLRSQ